MWAWTPRREALTPWDCQTSYFRRPKASEGGPQPSLKELKTQRVSSTQVAA